MTFNQGNGTVSGTGGTPPTSRGSSSTTGGQPGGGRKHRHDDEEQGKLFVGGLSWDTTQDTLLTYFGRFGAVIDCVVMKNPESGRSRGFGFVTFQDPANIEAVLSSCPHTLDGRTIDPKACNPRSMQKPKKSSVQHYPKVFLGGLPSSITETDLRAFFNRYGEVIEVVIMYDQERKKSRGFGFLSFADDAACNRAVAEHYVNIQNKQVEIKKAEPRTQNQASLNNSGNASRDCNGPDHWASPPMAPNGHPPHPPIGTGHPHSSHPQSICAGWGGPPAPASAAPPPHPSTAYPPQYTNPAAPAPPHVAPSSSAPPAAAPPHWSQPPGQPHHPPHHPPTATSPPTHWGHHAPPYASGPPPGSAQGPPGVPGAPPSQPTQYPGAVYPPPSTPQPQSFWSNPHAPPQQPPSGDIYGHHPAAGQPSTQKIEYAHPYSAAAAAPAVTVAAAYPPFTQYQQAAPTQPAPVKHVTTTYPPYEYQATSPGLSYPGQADVSGSLGPQRGAVYGTTPSPYHPYRRT